MSLWNNLHRHDNSKWKKTSAGTLDLDDRNNIKGEVSNAPRLNMNHGFIKSIVRNQIDRDEYDKLVSEKSFTSSYRYLEKPRKTFDSLLLYIPPHLRNINVETTKNEKDSDIKDEKEKLRKEIRRRLMEQMAKEEHERFQIIAETVIPNSTLIKQNADIRRRSNFTTTIATSKRIGPLFKLNIRTQNGNSVEQIVHANDNSARIAKALTRQLELTDDQETPGNLTKLRINIAVSDEKKNSFSAKERFPIVHTLQCFRFKKIFLNAFYLTWIIDCI
ncbi:UPF0561 protein [Dirofilaria immitis]